MDPPSAPRFAGRLDRTSTARRGSAAHHASARQLRWVSVAVMMILTTKRNIGGPVVQSNSTTPDGAAKWRNRTYRRFQVADLWTTPPGPGWSRVVQPGPGWSSRGPVGSAPPCGQTERCAQQGRQRDRTAASSNGPQRHVAPIAAGLQGRRGVSPGWRAVDQAGPPLTGPRWSRVVQGGPGWSRQRGVGGAQPIIPERCAIDAQCDSASIG